MPSRQSLIWNVPYLRNPFFTGRSQILDELHDKLTTEGTAALSGMGGIGKTQTAAEYAYRYRGDYSAVLWVKADSEESFQADFALLAVSLGLLEQSEADREVIIAAVGGWLNTNTGWLLILDNADDLTLVYGLLRREWGGQILLTTRAHATGDLSRVEIIEMEPAEGALFLLRRSKLIAADDALGASTEADRELAAEISREVDGLPLALDQAGAFVEEMSSSLGEYLRLYRAEGAQLRAARGGIVSDHAPVTITFSLAFRQVEAMSAAAADLLRVCAFLAPDAIPEEIFVNGAAELGGNLAFMAGGGINLVKLMGEATRFSLIRRNAKIGVIEIHRLVQQVLKDEMDADTRRLWAERVVRGLKASFPDVDHKNWLFCEKFLSHVQEAAGLIDEYNLEFNDAAWLLNEAGNYCDDRAQYTEAEPLYVQALAIRERALGPDHPFVATSLNNLGHLYTSQGRYVEAEPLYVRALAIRQNALAPEDTDVALSLNNLAYLYDRQGRYAEAEPLYVQALSIYEKVRGPGHPNVAMCLNNLAHIYVRQGGNAEAEPLLARALAIRQNALAPEDTDVALSLNNLAYLYESTGSYEEAEPLHVQALAIRERALGPDHPTVASSLNNLACLYDNTGRSAEAEPLHVRALAIRETVLGPEHPEVAISLNNLAHHYCNQGRDAEAEPLYVRALSIYEKALAPEHPEVAMSLNNLAYFYSSQGRDAEAEPLYVRALSIYEKALAPEHPEVALVRRNYDELLRKKLAN